MREQIKQLIIKLLGLVDAFASHRTEQKELLGLLDKLRPILPATGLIRLGPTADGGYLVPNDLDGIKACYSPGVNDQSGFELDCARRGMRVFLADRSVERPAAIHSRFHFTGKHLGANPSEDVLTLEDWVSATLPGSDDDLMLQMDVEGAEYEILVNAPTALLRRFRIVVAEFHLLDQLWSAPFFRLASVAFARLVADHRCVHIHPNNCCGSVRFGAIEIPKAMEFTFLRQDRAFATALPPRYPHPLDVDNSPGPSLVLPPCWFQTDRPSAS